MVKKTTLGNYFKSLDLFSTNVTFWTNERDSFGTTFGACVSVIIALLVAVYGANRLRILLDKDDTLFNEFSVIDGLS